MINNLNDKAVIITGGTKGIGLAIGLQFAQQGAHVYLTHRWSSADEEAILAGFRDAGAKTPTIVEADVSVDEETIALLELVARVHDSVEAFISNVCVVQPANGVMSYRKRSLLKSLEYSAWPMVSYLQQIKKRFGRLPRYVVGISSDGSDNYFTHYEYVAASKAVMDVLCRYLTHTLRDEDIRINILKSRNVMTDAVEEIFGPHYVDFMRERAGEEYFIYPDEIGKTALALCSGLLDSMKGQVIQVDKGMSFADTMMKQLEKHERRLAE